MPTTLDAFGNLLMAEVRDEAIADWKAILNGTLKGDRAERIRKLCAGMRKDEVKRFLQLVPEVIDTTIHHLLRMLDETEDVRIAMDTPGSQTENLRELSDGLAGELYTAAGWIARFSQESMPGS